MLAPGNVNENATMKIIIINSIGMKYREILLSPELTFLWDIYHTISQQTSIEIPTKGTKVVMSPRLPLACNTEWDKNILGSDPQPLKKLKMK